MNLGEPNDLLSWCRLDEIIKFVDRKEEVLGVEVKGVVAVACFEKQIFLKGIVISKTYEIFFFDEVQ